MEKHFLYGNAEKNNLGMVKEENKYNYDNDEFNNISLDNDDSSHVQIIRLIENGKKVLDVGCADGLLSTLIKKFRNVEIDGIEYDKEAYEIAKKRNVFNEVYNFSILDKNNSDYKKIKKNKYDVIIFGDVIEHLTEPWEALINIYDWLKEDGKVIISLPCISNFDIIKGLINGEFNYSSHGILDTTHVKFYTALSFKDMIENVAKRFNIKYNLELVSETHFLPPYDINDAFANLFKEDGNINFEYFIMQNIFILTKSKTDKIKVKGIIKQNRYEKIVKKIEDINKKNQELENKVRELENTIINQDERYKILENDYNAIINSKGWKLLEKFHKIKK